MNDKWARRWKAYPKCRQTKIFFSEPDKGKSKKLLEINREDLSTMVQWLTGHCFLNRHEKIVGNLDFNECRFCFLEEETSSHIITDCEVFWHERMQCFPCHPFLDKETPEWTVDRLAKFLETPAIKTMNRQLMPEMPLTQDS